MKPNQSIFLFLIFFLTACQPDRTFPEVKKLTEYKATEFTPTLENEISKDKNSVYCVTLLYAWDEIRKVINEPLKISKDAEDLTLLNDSKSYIDVLKSDEYSASGTVENNLISARSEFKKSLPFEVKLENFENELMFNDERVPAFGVNGYSEDELFRNVDILYYKNDNHFIVKLIPTDENHEIILFKSTETYPTMTAMNEAARQLIKKGKQERENEKLIWKYYFDDEDELMIPKFSFNIETNYLTLEGKKIKTPNQGFEITKAWQRTAFILDEYGAEIESEAIVEASQDAAQQEYEKPQPKKMFFDKPFFTMLQRTDAKFPYFVMWTVNTELMQNQ
ncbi:MAG: hypothetical protein AB8G11_16890 [Saprospiraceae bacterium]